MSELNISGEWSVEEEWWSENGDHGKEKYHVFIEQKGQKIEMEFSDEEDLVVLGYLKGNIADMNSYKYKEKKYGGNTEVFFFEVEFFNDGKNAKHRDTWEWRNNRESEKGESEGQWKRISSF